MPGDLENYIINRAAARYMEMDSPIGQRLVFWGRTGTIIGLVEDFHQVSLHREIMPQIISANLAFSNGLKFVFVKIRPENIPETLAYLQRAFEEFSPMFPFEYSFVDKGIDDLYASLGFRHLLTFIDGAMSFLTKAQPLSDDLKCVPATRLARCPNSCTTGTSPYSFLPRYTAALMMDEKETLGRRRK